MRSEWPRTSSSQERSEACWRRWQRSVEVISVRHASTPTARSSMQRIRQSHVFAKPQAWVRCRGTPERDMPANNRPELTARGKSVANSLRRPRAAARPER